MTNSIDSAIARISEKLARIRSGSYQCFGSEKHGFELKPPLSEDALTAFELAHDVRLPDDYRRFLATIGNGGAGPYYGILPLERWNAAAIADVPRWLSRASPLRPGMEPGISWDEALGCTWDELFQGALALNEQGGSYYGLLILTGDYRGRVVYVDLEGNGVPYFVAHPDFLSWYERWLDELIAGWDVSWFGFGHPGTPDELSDIVMRSADATLRAEALHSLSRIPKLDARALTAAETALRDPNPRARCWALTIMAKQAPASAVSAVRPLLSDPEAEVRKEALRAYWFLGAADRVDVARALIGDADDDVVFSALGVLKDAKQLRRSDLAPLLHSDSVKKRSHAAWAVAYAIDDG